MKDKRHLWSPGRLLDVKVNKHRSRSPQGVLSYPWTKLVVPSTGSMIHVGLSVKMQACPFATDSSPMKLQQRGGRGWSGVRGQGSGLRALPHQCVPSPNFFFREPMMILSTCSSVLVTRSTAELLVWTLISLSPAFLTS